MSKALRITGLILLFTLAALFFTHDLGSINQDIGRHLKFGQIIWQTHHVPETNFFSYTFPNQPFDNHHWLSEVIFYLVSLGSGLKGLILLKTAILVSAFWLLYEGVKQRVSPAAFILASIVGLAVIVDRTDVRPEIFSYLFLAYFLFAIFRDKYQFQRKWLYALPFVELLWANMHIYFPFGLGLIGLYTLESLIARNPDWKHLAWVTLACAAVTLLNPNGLAGALTPFTIFNNYGYAIVENQGILFLKNYGILLTQVNIFLVTVIGLGLSFLPLIRTRSLRSCIFEIGTALTFTILGMKMIRNFGPFAITMVPIAAINITVYFKTFGWSESLKRWGYAVLGLLLILGIGEVVTSSAYGWVGNGDHFGLEVPVGAQGGIDFVLANHIAGPVFNNFDVGGYLIWKLYPQQQVFVDGRPEAYPAKFFSDVYEPMQEDPRTWKHYADDVYHINYVFFDYRDITPWAQTFLSFISQDPTWPKVYQDSSTVIFLRRSAQNLPIIEKLR